MTWYAHHIFAAPAALEQLAAAFPGHVFHVRNLDEYKPTRHEVSALMLGANGLEPMIGSIVEGPRLPAAGLVVVRELAEPDSHVFKRFRESAVSWYGVGEPDPDVIRVSVDEPAPESLLGFLRRLSRATSSVVTMFCAATWGGDLEYAHAWVFDGEWDADRVYVYEEKHQVRAWATREASRVIVDGDVLTLALLHHGVMLEAGQFELHKRAFPWDRHRVGGNYER
jgi:hypothetical protein